MTILEPLSQFHFLRPGFLLLALPSIAIYLAANKLRHDASPWREFIAEKFLPYFQLQTQARHWLEPNVYSLLLALVWIIAIAGPSWQPAPSALSQGQNSIVVALQLNDTMLEKEGQDSPLDRAKIKILELLEHNKSAKIGLLVYAGSAHEVLSPSKDHDVLRQYVDDLSPALMPVQGNQAEQALNLASDLLGQSGSVLFISSGLDTDVLLGTGLEQKPTNSHRSVLILSAADIANIAYFKSRAFNIVYASPGPEDIAAVTRGFQQSWIKNSEGEQQWQDQGYYFVWLLLVMILPWFRKGMVLSWR